jgi:hypothetical protein
MTWKSHLALRTLEREGSDGRILRQKGGVAMAVCGVMPVEGDAVLLSPPAGVQFRLPPFPAWFRVVGVEPGMTEGFVYLTGCPMEAAENDRSRRVFCRVAGLVIRQQLPRLPDDRHRRSGRGAVRMTDAERSCLAVELAESYRRGDCVRVLMERTGHSYGFIYRLLVEAGVAFRSQGWRPRRTDEPCTGTETSDTGRAEDDGGRRIQFHG